MIRPPPRSFGPARPLLSRRERGALAAALALALACATPRAAGRAIPELSRLPTPRGERLPPSYFEGRVTVVTFLATWCFPCLGQIPVLQDLQERHPEVRVIGVGMDLDGAQVLEPFANAYRLRFPLLVADREILEGESAFGRIRELPTTLVLGPDGEPVKAFAGPSTLEAIEALLARIDRAP